GADVFIDDSAPELLDEDDMKNMNSDAIVFAMSNPDPEINAEVAARNAAVIATGHADYSNQINKMVGFPGLLSAQLDAHCHNLTDQMLVAATEAIASCASADELNPSYIIPAVFDAEVSTRVADAIVETAQQDT